MCQGQSRYKNDVFKSALANIINTITHEIVHTKEVYGKWISHKQDFYKKQIVSLGDFAASKDWGNIESFIRLCKINMLIRYEQNIHINNLFTPFFFLKNYF